jgi:hypothetical protein
MVQKNITFVRLWWRNDNARKPVRNFRFILILKRTSTYSQFCTDITYLFQVDYSLRVDSDDPTAVNAYVDPDTSLIGEIPTEESR